ncbi:hypothetical protein [Alkalibacter mobilis]|nr:hypothetical protein [Alkalibacter mobilis]
MSSIIFLRHKPLVLNYSKEANRPAILDSSEYPLKEFQSRDALNICKDLSHWLLPFRQGSGAKISEQKIHILNSGNI